MRVRSTFSLLRRSPGVILSIALLALLTFVLGWSHLLSLKAISMTGTNQVSLLTQQIENGKSPVRIGQPLARLDVHAIERRLAQNGWIERIHVGRSWLHGELTIAVSERLPVASYQGSDGATQYFDSHGNDFVSPLQYSGVPSIVLANQSKSAKESIAAFLAHLPATYLNQANSFTVTASDQIEMTLTRKSRTLTIIWGSSSDIELKIQVFEKLIALKENAQSTIFDLSDPLAPLTK